jgi:hypothetical protein
MATTVRLATAGDAPQWLDLVKSALGEEYLAREVYDPAWIATQIDSTTGHETWVAGTGKRLEASVSFLKPSGSDLNPIANLGRNLNTPESYASGAARSLLEKVGELTSERRQMIVSRVPVSDHPQQSLLEELGYHCVGFQPSKHMLRTRQGILFYVKPSEPILVTRSPLSESLPQISGLAMMVLEKFGISSPLTIRDGATGYPLHTRLRVTEASPEDYASWRDQAHASRSPVEVSGSFNLGSGLMRVTTHSPNRALLAEREGRVSAGLAFYMDEHDRCARVTDAFAMDDVSTGALLQHAVEVSQSQFGAVFVEVDVLMNAPRMLKSAEQLGFVPVGYLPAFYSRGGSYTDVVKLVKLNMAYTREQAPMTPESRAIVELVDRNFDDQRVGLAIINLLRTLPIFEGLGDGELRRIARLFVQKLYRPGEIVFRKGDSGEEAYIVMRGQVDISIDENSKPIGTLTNGKIFGEQAFLDGAPRVAWATATQPSILLVVQRAAMMDLIQREPHLGLIIMRNIALDLSTKLRHANANLAAMRR